MSDASDETQEIDDAADPGASEVAAPEQDGPAVAEPDGQTSAASAASSESAGSPAPESPVPTASNDRAGGSRIDAHTLVVAAIMAGALFVAFLTGFLLGAHHHSEDDGRPSWRFGAPPMAQFPNGAGPGRHMEGRRFRGDDSSRPSGPRWHEQGERRGEGESGRRGSGSQSETGTDSDSEGSDD